MYYPTRNNFEAVCEVLHESRRYIWFKFNFWEQFQFEENSGANLSQDWIPNLEQCPQGFIHFFEEDKTRNSSR